MHDLTSALLAQYHTHWALLLSQLTHSTIYTVHWPTHKSYSINNSAVPTHPANATHAPPALPAPMHPPVPPPSLPTQCTNAPALHDPRTTILCTNTEQHRMRQSTQPTSTAPSITCTPPPHPYPCANAFLPHSSSLRLGSRLHLFLSFRPQSTPVTGKVRSVWLQSAPLPPSGTRPRLRMLHRPDPSLHLDHTPERRHRRATGKVRSGPVVRRT